MRQFETIINKILSETYYTDLYPKAFLEFVKKYKKQKTDNTLYVQFTNYSGSVLEKTPYSTPDHTDPVGIYAYPLKYIIDYPADIRYGRSAKYLRVLRIKNINRSLNLGTMEYWLAKSILGRMIKNEDPEYLLSVAQKQFKYPNNRTRYAKQFFANVLFDLTQKIQTNNEVPYRLRSGEEQTKLLLLAGIWSLKDISKTRKLAVINKNEPEQIIFLNRNSFDVVETFELRDAITKNLMQNPDGNIDLAQKLANSIFTKIGDKILTSSESKHSEVKFGGTRSYDFFSKKGFHLNIKYDVEIPETWSFSEPTKHRDSKYFTRYYPTIYLYSDKQKINRKFDRSSTIKEISDYIGREYNNTKPNPDFKPLTLKSYQEELKREKEEAQRESIKKQQDTDNKYEMDFRNDILFPLLKKLNINVMINEDDKTLYHKALEYLLKKLSSMFPIGEVIDNKKLDKFWKETDLIPFRMISMNYNMNNLKNIFNKIMSNRTLSRERMYFIILDILRD